MFVRLCMSHRSCWMLSPASPAFLVLLLPGQELDGKKEEQEQFKYEGFQLPPTSQMVLEYRMNLGWSRMSAFLIFLPCLLFQSDMKIWYWNDGICWIFPIGKFYSKLWSSLLHSAEVCWTIWMLSVMVSDSYKWSWVPCQTTDSLLSP